MLIGLAACAGGPRIDRVEVVPLGAPVGPEAPAWPEPGAALRGLPVAFPESFGVHRITIDPGHGAAGNLGNTGAWCQVEAEHTLAVALELRDALEATGHFEVQLAREPGMLVDYGTRIEQAERFGAEVLLSLHTDIRGEGVPWNPTPDRTCDRMDDAPGFAVLYSDEGALAEARLELARVMARELAATGLPAYDGVEYEDLYQGDAAHPGVFLDRHVPSKRIRMLRRPAMTSVILETHHAADPREAERWEERRTRAVFEAAVITGLVTFLH